MPTAYYAGADLTIDLDAIASNWRRLQGVAGKSCECGAVVKADAYGLGVAPVAKKLHEAGCRTFFVATIDEGLELREILPASPIHVLNGPEKGAEAEMIAAGLIPALNAPWQIALWQSAADREGQSLGADLHLDTGMNRLGLSADEFDVVLKAPELLDGLDLQLFLSHLACADDPAHPMNEDQRNLFASARSRFFHGHASLANSAGLFLGPDWRFDMARPGIALYGGNPTPAMVNPMLPVVTLDAKILQLRKVKPGETVGYGATWSPPKGSKPRLIATVALGYADGFLRTASNEAFAEVGGEKVPQVGRVSMDSVGFDVTDAPDGAVRPGGTIRLLGPTYGVDDLAKAAGTIGYEILTSLGARYKRTYVSKS